MPIYTYHCAGCGADFEKLVRNGTAVACPECEGKKLERRMSLPARHGSGGKAADFSSLGPTGRRRRLLRRLLPLASALADCSRTLPLGWRRTRRSPRTTPASSGPPLRWCSFPIPTALLLIRRAERAGDPWSGQVGLPGGRHDPADADLLATASREAAEEVGHPARPAGLHRRARRRRAPHPCPPAHRRAPVRFRARGRRPSLALNPEVASAHWVELARLRHQTTIRPYSITLRGELRTFPAFHIDELVVWGMTERILSCFIQVVDRKSRVTD